ncbi:hypothetical protein Tco_1259910 [Tanacetum coccineum]
MLSTTVVLPACVFWRHGFRHFHGGGSRRRTRSGLAHRRLGDRLTVGRIFGERKWQRGCVSGVEQDQLTDLTTYVEGVVLGVTPDRWYWTLDGSGEFSVASARKVIDNKRFPEVSTQTRWIKAVPIKVNIHA